LLQRAALAALLALLLGCGTSQRVQPAYTAVEAEPSLREIARLVEEVRATSYPQLVTVPIKVESMQSDYVFFETRFTIASYLSARTLRYMIFFNSEAMKRGVPPVGLKAIIAHELAHIDYYRAQSRMGLLSLARLVLPSFNTRFERQADLEAIALGYGPGLEEFRKWLYVNIPADRVTEKKRDYYAPEEIDAILSVERTNPKIMHTFERCVPRNLAEITRAARNEEAPCRSY